MQKVNTRRGKTQKNKEVVIVPLAGKVACKAVRGC